MKKNESLERSIGLLQPYLAQLIIHKDEIINNWITAEGSKDVLVRYGISPEQFKKDFGSDIYDYFLGIVAGKKNFGQCPTISNLIEYLKSKNLRSEELFYLCSNLKLSVLETVIDKENDAAQAAIAISSLFDNNFKGVLSQYTTTIYLSEQQAVDASLAREHFLSSMSHEIRTPLNAILGFVSLLKDDPISQKQEKYLDIISSSGENLLRIINDILDFSKLRSGEFTIENTSFNVYDALTEVLELFVPLATQKGVLLKSFIDPSVEYELFGDGDRIKQIVSNLLSNAIKFSTGDGSYVDVEAYYSDDKLFIEVKDNGIGIDKGDLEYIFNPFSQVKENWKDYYGGTGLGLPICKQLSHLMGGSLSVRSKLKKGSTFILELPVKINKEKRIFAFDRSKYEPIRFGFLKYDEKDSFKVESLQRYMNYFKISVVPLETIDDSGYDILVFMANSISDDLEKQIIDRNIPSVAILDFFEARYEDTGNISPLAFPIYCNKIKHAVDRAMGWLEVKEVEPAKSLMYYGGKVLIAEDNQANQELLRFLLEKYHIASTIVSNGLEAYNVMLDKGEEYDMILMDQQMPVMNGDDATRMIKTYEIERKLNHTPVIAITANVIQSSKEKVTQSGYDGFLGKPILIKELELVFEQYLKKETDAPVLKKSDLPIVVDKENSKASWNVDFEAIESILLLDKEQIIYLLDVYREKMSGMMTSLEDCIKKRSYKKIATISHEIKGSSSNFRFEEIYLKSQTIEENAHKKNKSYDYAKAFETLQQEFKKLFG